MACECEKLSEEEDECLRTEDIQPVKTIYGTYNLCKHCRDNGHMRLENETR